MSKAATADSYSKNMLHQKVFRTIICILFCIIALLPFVLLVMNATRDSESIKAGVSLIPSTHLIENWKNLMIKQNGMQITLQKAIINSATITIPGTFLSVYFSSLTAYGIHVYDFKFKKFAWAFIMAVMMVPSQISIIGFYRFMLDLKLIDKVVTITNEEAISTARRLMDEEGILAGISSGAAVAAALKLQEDEAFTNKNIVVILPSSGERYLSTALFADLFTEKELQQ